MPETKSSEISRDAIFRKWPMYECLVRDRLIMGSETYGDISFIRPHTELLKEIAEELLDVSGWAFILWTRIQELESKMKEPEE
jgi:hypothetical protein